jgi:hypothetical protein
MRKGIEEAVQRPSMATQTPRSKGLARDRVSRPSEGDKPAQARSMPVNRLNEMRRGVPVADAGLPLTRTELEIVDLFSGFAKGLGMPASAGGIYGLLFAARIPLHMNQIK